MMTRRHGVVEQASLVVSCKTKFSHLILFRPHTVLQFKFCNTSNQKFVTQFSLACTVLLFQFEKTSEIFFKKNGTFMNA